MNPILLIFALLILALIVVEVRVFILVKWYSKKILAQVISIEIKDTYTRKLTKILQGGNHKQIKTSYKFQINNKEFKVIDDEIPVPPKSKLINLKKGDNMYIYVYLKNNMVKDTWLGKPELIQLTPFVIMFLVTLLVAYLSADMYYAN